MSLIHLFSQLPTSLQDGLLSKVAEERKEPTFGSRAGTILKGVGAVGLGTAAAAGMSYGADRLHQHVTGKPIPIAYLGAALPLLTVASGYAYNKYKAKEKEQLDGIDTSHKRAVTGG